jgi:hypothetical protein
MDDPLEVSQASTPAEIEKTEHSDLCVTLYTLWDRLVERGQVAGRNLFSCRNDSSVPDSCFNLLAQKALIDCDSVVDRGEMFVLAAVPYDVLRDSVATALCTALEAL